MATVTTPKANPYTTVAKLDKIFNVLQFFEEEAQCTKSDILKAFESGKFEDKRPKENEAKDKDWHARRVAYFMANWDDSPLSIDLGIPGYGIRQVMSDDSYHKLAAAVLTKRKRVFCNVSGEVCYIVEALGENSLDKD